MGIMTEEEMDYQIELNELHSNKNDCTENLYEFTRSELSVHDVGIRADAIKKFVEWLVNSCDVCSEDYPFGMNAKALLYEYEISQKKQNGETE